MNVQNMFPESKPVHPGSGDPDNIKFFRPGMTSAKRTAMLLPYHPH
jgi:hypothetical protein